MHTRRIRIVLVALSVAVAVSGVAYFCRDIVGGDTKASSIEGGIQPASVEKEAMMAGRGFSTDNQEGPLEDEPESESATQQIVVIPGADWVLMKREVLRSPIGAEGLGEIFTHPGFSDEERAEHLAAVTLNRNEDPEVRMEALDQWLKMLPEGADSFLVSLARDDRMDPSMCAILLKDTLSRGRRIQAEVALVFLQSTAPDIKDLAREQLVVIAGADHGPDPISWQYALDSILR